MNPARNRSVWRYFIPADAFVRIRLCSGSAEVQPRPGLDQAGYRRLTIQACCPDLAGDAGDTAGIAERIAELSPHDPLTAEELLYQLCVEVNPELDIHRVVLVDDEAEPTERPAHSASAQAAPEPRAAAALDSIEAWQRRIRHASHDLGARLAERVIGQDEAIAAVERAVRKAAAGLAEEHRPLASFLFVGRTGTGKTELVRQLAQELYGACSERPLVRIDCSEYSAAHEYAKLIGAPPGYVGHENGGMLTDAVRRSPECVVLFDEIEKAHTRMHQLLLQILDDGHLTDSHGRRVDFRRTLVVMTSNLGSEEIRNASQRVGFVAPALPGQPGVSAVGRGTQRELTNQALEDRFSPEFLGRIDERILFRELDLDDARRIGRGLLADLGLRARRRSVELDVTPAVATWVAREGYDPATGARELRRVVQRGIEAPLSELMLDGGIREGGRVRVSISKGEPRFSVEG